MKNTQRSLILILGLIIPSFVFAHATIGIFDIDRALFETEAWKTELNVLETQFIEEQDTVAQLRAELEELFENIQVNGPTLAENEIERLREESQFKQLRIKQIGERVQASLRETQSNFLERYRSLLSDAINDIYEQGSYDFILSSESVVISGFSFDVTPAVTAKLNELIASSNQPQID